MDFTLYVMSEPWFHDLGFHDLRFHESSVHMDQFWPKQWIFPCPHRHSVTSFSTTVQLKLSPVYPIAVFHRAHPFSWCIRRSRPPS